MAARADGLEPVTFPFMGRGLAAQMDALQRAVEEMSGMNAELVNYMANPVYIVPHVDVPHRTPLPVFRPGTAWAIDPARGVEVEWTAAEWTADYLEPVVQPQEGLFRYLGVKP